MRALAKLYNQIQQQQPVLIVVCFDSLTRTPQYCLIQENPTEVSEITFGDLSLPTIGALDTVQLDTNTPSNGGGLIRRQGSLVINSRDANGIPFNLDPFNKKFYSTGVRYQDFYFGIWVIDRAFINDDIRGGMFLGYYQIQPTINWTEDQVKTTVPIFDILTLEDGIIGVSFVRNFLGNLVEEPVALPAMRLFNPWITKYVVPKVYGQVERIKLVNDFPSFSLKQLSQLISGRLQRDFLLTDTNIKLQLAELDIGTTQLNQLVGYRVRIKIGTTGEVILGDVSTGLVAGVVDPRLPIYLINITRNVYYAKSNGYTYAPGFIPQVNGGAGNPIPANFSFTASVIFNGRNLIQDANGYMQAQINFFDNAVTGKDVFYTVQTKLNGWQDQKLNIVNHARWEKTSIPTYSGDTNAGLSGQFQGTPTVANPILSTSWTPGVYLYFKSVPTDVFFWFNPATIGTQATATATLTSGALTSVTITSGGTGYSEPPKVRIIGVPTGQVAEAVAIITAGVVTAINVTVPGSGYTATPIIQLVGGQGGEYDAFFGDPWSLVAIEATGAGNSRCFIQNGYSRFDNDHIYTEGEGSLIKIPKANIVAIYQNAGYSTVETTGGPFARIELTTPPLDMNIGATSNIVYADAMYVNLVDGARTEKIINEILKDSALLKYFADDTITALNIPYALTPWVPYIGILTDGSESVTALLDRILFQVAKTFRYRGSTFYIDNTGRPLHNDFTASVLYQGDLAGAHPYDPPAINYIKLPYTHVDNSIYIENSCEISIGKMNTVDYPISQASGVYDYTKVDQIVIDLTYDYGSWQDPNYKKQGNSDHVPLKYGRKFRYAFDLIQDSNDLSIAGIAGGYVGGAWGLNVTEKTYSFKTTLYGMAYEALDPLVLKDFPVISDAIPKLTYTVVAGILVQDNPPKPYKLILEDTDDGHYMVRADGIRYVTGPLVQVYSTSAIFSLSSQEIKIITKQAQSLVSLSISNGGTPGSPPGPLPPPPPSGNPNTNPGTGGGLNPGAGGGGPGHGESLDMVISGLHELEIDGTDDEVCDFTVSGTSGFGTGVGFCYTIENATIDGYDISAGVTISPVSGCVSDVDHFGDTPTVNTHHLHVNYAWFTPVPVSFINRTVRLKFTRIVVVSDDFTYTDIEYRDVDVIIDDPRDISAS